MILMDYIVIILLTVTIGFCWKLNKKIIQLNNSRGELSKIFKNFEMSITKAEEIIQDIKVTSQREFMGLDRKIDIAHRAINELEGLNHVSKQQLHELDKAINQANLYKNIHNNTNYNNSVKHQTVYNEDAGKTSSTIVTHRTNSPRNASGIEMIASKTIPVYSGSSNAGSIEEKRAMIESLLSKIKGDKG